LRGRCDVSKDYKPSPWGEKKNAGQEDMGTSAKEACIIDGKYGQCGIIVLWEDGHLSVDMGTDSPVQAEAEKGSSYTSSRPEGDRLYYIAKSHYAGMGFKIREIPF
jgi:hypothetical protein